MTRVLLVGERITAADWAALRAADGRGTAVSFLPPEASDPPPVGMVLRAPPETFPEERAAARDGAAFAFASRWHEALREPLPVSPRHGAILVFLEAVDVLRRFDFLDAVASEVRPREIRVAPDGSAATRDAAAFVGERLGAVVDAPAAPRLSGRWRARLRQAAGRWRFRRARPAGAGPLLLWSYPKMRAAPLVESLHARGARFLLHEREEGFWEKGIPYVFLDQPPRDAARWRAFLGGVPAVVPPEATAAAPLLRRALARVLAPVFAETTAVTEGLARHRGRVDAVVAADFVSGASAAVCDWAASRGIPVMGIQHGAPTFDHWLRLGHACPGTILAWDGEASLARFRAAGIPVERLRRIGCPGHDRWVAAASARDRRPDLILYAAVECPYMTARFSETLTARMVGDLLSAAAAFPAFEVVLKPHPSQPAPERALLARLAAAARGVRARVAREGETVEALLPRAGAVATRLSTMAVEAGLLGVPVVRLDYGLADHPWVTGFLRDPRVPGGGTVQALREVLARVLGHGAREASSSARAFAADWDAADGRATARVVDTILAAAGR